MKVGTFLYSEHEEAEERFQYHISHAVKVDSIELASVWSGDTDVDASILKNFEHHWKQHELHRLWSQQQQQQQLAKFGQNDLNSEMMKNAEEFLIEFQR